MRKNHPNGGEERRILLLKSEETPVQACDRLRNDCLSSNEIFRQLEFKVRGGYALPVFRCVDQCIYLEISERLIQKFRT
jgi:hypothetical protein